jgi:penicillin-binding protein 2
VCVLFQGGEHGRLAARLATQVIKAYVDKQRRTPTKMVEKPTSKGTVDIGGLWTVPDSDEDKQKLEGGRFVLDLPSKPLALATAAPGMVR